MDNLVGKLLAKSPSNKAVELKGVKLSLPYLVSPRVKGTTSSTSVGTSLDLARVKHGTSFRTAPEPPSLIVEDFVKNEDFKLKRIDQHKDGSTWKLPVREILEQIGWKLVRHCPRYSNATSGTFESHGIYLFLDA